MIVETGDPYVQGDYVAFSDTSTYRDRPFSLILEWTGSAWKYHGSHGLCKVPITGWIGPLPRWRAPEYDL